MIQLRLFRAAEPFEPIEERCLDEGELVIGRDPSAHWMIADESCELSRRHCTISLRSGGAVLRDTSSNGVFVGDARTPAPRDGEMALAPFETLHLGQFLIVLEPRDAALGSDASAFRTLFQPVVPAAALQVASDWDVENEPIPANDRRPFTDAALLEAFCAGAGLDPSSFVGEDPEQVMARVGAIYKQTIVGLSDLLSERHIVKSELNMERTSVGANGNNPFKWAPTRRVAVDLLRERKDGFLFGSAALKASFEDLKKHGLCLMGGSRASVDHVLRALAPQTLENQVLGQGLLRLNKFESCWRAFENAHAHLADEEPGGPQCSIDRAFRAGYERRLRDLEEGGTKS